MLYLDDIICDVHFNYCNDVHEFYEHYRLTRTFEQSENYEFTCHFTLYRDKPMYLNQMTHHISSNFECCGNAILTINGLSWNLNDKNIPLIYARMPFASPCLETNEESVSITMKCHYVCENIRNTLANNVCECRGYIYSNGSLGIL